MGSGASRFEWFRNRHEGERGVLVANGPSLNDMDLSFLRHEICIGLNKIFLGFRRFRFYPRYYVAVNRKVIEQSVEEIKALSAVKFISSRGKDLIGENALTYLIETANRPERFYHDIAEGVQEGWTVTYAALQIAFFLGFKEIVIIGMDHRYFYSGEPNQAQVLEGEDPNHFSPDYFGGGQTWDNPDLARSGLAYRFARREFEKADRRIIDATLNGACSVFEKADYRKLFGVAA